MSIDKEKIFQEAMREARKVLGADPAYFGKEGEEEVVKQLNKMGYKLEDIQEK